MPQDTKPKTTEEAPVPELTRRADWSNTEKKVPALSALEATQGQRDGFFSQHPYKCHLEEVVSVED